MHKSPSLIERWRVAPYLQRLAAVAGFYLVMSVAFYTAAINGPDLRSFIVVVLVCFSVITLFLVRHIYIGLLMMMVAGSMGWLTDIWGVTNNLWNYHGNENSFFELHPDAVGGGVPIEIVLAYFCSAMWLTQIIESLFDVELDRTKEHYLSGESIGMLSTERLILLGSLLLSMLIGVLDPLYTQPLVTFNVGLAVALMTPRGVRNVAVVFGVATGFGGLFFEMFCTGQLSPDIAIWSYTDGGHDPMRWTIGVLMGYSGSGALLAGAYLLLLKSPLFRTTRELLPHPSWV